MAIQNASLLLFFSLFLLVALQSDAQDSGVRVSLKHISPRGGASPLTLLKQSLARAQARVKRINMASTVSTANRWLEASAIDATGTGNIAQPEAGDFESLIRAGSGEYIIAASLGTPPVHFAGIMDSGSDLIWAFCKPCPTCPRPNVTVFDPNNSTTFSNMSCTNTLCKALTVSHCTITNRCGYTYGYGDASVSRGFMGYESFSFGLPGRNKTIPNIAFGCGVDNRGAGMDKGHGLVGLGRGPLSLISQLNATKFSYCLGSFTGNTSSTLFIGSEHAPDPVKTTRLLRSSSLPSFYYASLEGISVGDTRLAIPKSTFELQPDGSGGVIIDSGTTVTMLTEDAYEIVRSAFSQQSKLKKSEDGMGTGGLDLCFTLPPNGLVAPTDVPKLVFHFEGVDVDLPVENYMVSDKTMGVSCLAMGPSGGLSIFGNVQQQNMLVIYDLQHEKLQFVPKKCDEI